ncbi:ABC transporter domain containing protein [Sporothrix schenckii 1099-18]|uniref:ABC transporter domain containing protein n=1 Tax=Sporothrix schenckii 1099-18 TaxID=1397361 RepID=A0A0F2M8P6_SPOSC|nr:ABC transporter domain containing protein [Sporothrix schenckii 1099-18]KJR85200.1 ABC transporter domain containing protein [Sporothrix schenckii 1099-18]
MGAGLFFRQVWTLSCKNIRIVLIRNPLATVIRAFVIPLILFAFFSFAKYLFVPPAVFGVGTLKPLLSLSDALADAAITGRHTVAFYNGGFAGGAIDAVIDSVATQVEQAGSIAVRLANESQIETVCHSSLRGVTTCYGAVFFVASPNEGSGGIWTYDIRLDGSLGAGKINVDKGTNDGEVYMLPFQHAIDATIVGQQTNSTASNNVIANGNVHEYPFTSLTPAERSDEIRVQYQASLTNFLAVAFISGVIGICYHLTGFVATERELGMATLLDSMMATSDGGRRWGEAQVARLVSYHLSFVALYLPGWVLGSAIVSASVFAHSNAAVIILYHVTVGLALASMSLLGASLFRRSQLSGVSVTIVYLLLAIIAQTLTRPPTPTVTVLSLLFAPCNYVYFVTNVARWERKEWPINLVEVAPDSPWHLPGIVLWVFLLLQIIIYPIIGAYIERYLYGTITTGRTIETRPDDGGVDANGNPLPALQLDAFSKTYSPGPLRRAFGWAKKAPEPVHAVKELTLSAVHGQILVLLGANGSGKSTTLDAIAGTSKLTSGRITLDGTRGLGIAPQKNVMWDQITVEEHLHIFNRLKSPFNRASREEIRDLIKSIDLEHKATARAKTLSGGQQRKLQLGMMLTGGSAVCCVDEVSSGLDPLSRRKIWDILLAERGRRTIIMTTHFLDEADLLSDHIAILSKGTLRADGSSVALKDRLGGGYRIHVHKTKPNEKAAVVVRSDRDLPDVEGVVKKNYFDLVTYIAPSSGQAAQVIRTLEAAGVTDYRFSGPTLEDVFLQLAEEVQQEQEEHEKSQSVGTGPDQGKESSTSVAGDKHEASDEAKPAASGMLVPNDSNDGVIQNADGNSGLKLLSGRRIGYWQQALVLFRKRFVVFKHNWVPSAAALAIPVLAAGLVTLFVRNQQPVGCSSADQLSNDRPQDLADFGDYVFLVAGPAARFGDINAVIDLFTPMFTNSSGNGGTGSSSNDTAIIAQIFTNITLADTFDDFNELILQYRRNVTPAGLWLGDGSSPPTVAYLGDYFDHVNAFFGQNLMNALLANLSISARYADFDIPWSPSTGNSLQMLVYVCLACAAYPGFFSLYPNLERRRHVRGLEYSNGVRALPLWMAYVGFDLAIVLVSSALMTILFAALSSVWYHVGYLFLIFALYGLASALLAYNISLFSRNQLTAYAFTAAYQAIVFLVYMIAYLATITYAPVNHIDADLLVVHFVASAFAPIGSVIRSLFVVLNLFSVTCDGTVINNNPGSFTLYGGPIFYLIWQSILLFGVLLWFDSGNVGASFYRLTKMLRRKKSTGATPQVFVDIDGDAFPEDAGRVGEGPAPDRGLCVSHVTKTFKRNTAVDNVSFDVNHGEVFALLGPNGAGKSTTISVIRGDLKPDDGDVFVEGLSVTKKLVAARGSLGVCPQFDAVDQMTVREHLRFYARVRGIEDVEYNVQAVIRAVGLRAFSDRQALALSGGNKRKLSLGIALMGNPAVVILDEPSSGLDAAAKRIMWRTLAATVPGRSILLTTHSMEEADALAGRAGILAKRMLAAGDTDDLRARFGNRLYVHLVIRGAPRTSDADTARLRQWVQDTLPGVEIDKETYHGQMRFAIPLGDMSGRSNNDNNNAKELDLDDDSSSRATPSEKNVATSTTTSPGTLNLASASSTTSAIGRLVVLFDEHRQALGIDHYSVSPTTLDQVFLEIVGRHNIQEEGYHREEEAAAAAAAARKKKWWKVGSR